MLSILNKLTLQKELQNVCDKYDNMLLDKKYKPQQTRDQTKFKPVPELGIEPGTHVNAGTSRTQSGCDTSAPLSQQEY